MEPTEFADQYTAHFAGTVKLLRRKTQLSDADAEDLAQSAWVRAWVHREQFNGTAQFHSWVFAIAFNELRSIKRRPVRIEYREQSQIPECPVTYDYSAPILLAELLDRALPYDRLILFQRYYLDLSIEELSQRTSRPTGTIKSETHRALARLRHVATSTPTSTSTAASA